MKIAIIGTRGIPNRYGGFEQFASRIAPMLARDGHQVYVYNSSTNGYPHRTWNQVRIITKHDPRKALGTLSQFIYDFLCIRDCRYRDYDLIFQLGYTSSSLWGFLFPGRAVLVTHMDGLEWKRAKYNRLTRVFLRFAEKRAVVRSDVLIADAKAIGRYLSGRFGKQAVFIPYGADIPRNPAPDVLDTYGLRPFGYHLVIARFEPENNLEMIIQGHLEAPSTMPLILIGNPDNAFGKRLRKRYRHPGILFTGALYDTVPLDTLRHFSRLYFHGHSVGGTNPSLLEAMAAGCLIAAHENEFNREVLGEDAYYFEDATQIAALVRSSPCRCDHAGFLDHNLEKIRSCYRWDNVLQLIHKNIIDRYAYRL